MTYRRKPEFISKKSIIDGVPSVWTSVKCINIRLALVTFGQKLIFGLFALNCFSNRPPTASNKLERDPADLTIGHLHHEGHLQCDQMLEFKSASKKGGSPGLVGGDSCSKGCEFKS